MNQDSLLYTLIVTEYNKVVEKYTADNSAIFRYPISYEALTPALLKQLNEAGFTTIIGDYFFDGILKHNIYKRIDTKIEVAPFCPFCGGARAPEKYT